MSSRKQRRRRAKERRHDYEYVYVDEEGQEVETPPEADEARPSKNGASAAKPKAKSSAKKPGTARAGGRAGRVVSPPSWARVAKRGALFAPLMFITISLLSRNMTIAARILQTAWLMALFIPFSYLVDRTMYRRYLRQTGQLPPPAKKSG